MLSKFKKIKLDNIDVTLSVTDTDTLKRLSMLNFNKTDLKYLKNLKSIIEENIVDIIDGFYDVIASDKEMTDIINNNSSIDRLKLTLRTHILQMFSGTLDDDYSKKRKTIAQVHVRIGLKTQAYITSFESINKSVHTLIQKHISNADDKLNTTYSVSKIINLEQQLVLSAYDELLKSQQDSIEDERVKLNTAIVESSVNLAAISEQTYASYQQLQNQARNVLSYAIKAKELSSQMELHAIEGKGLIKNQTNSMDNIVDSVCNIEHEIKNLGVVSKKIEEVVLTVNNIANQTNLLSLNASIEAARAGVHGLGFSVVAQEVRKLSDETKMSIKNVDELLEYISTESVNLQSSLAKVSESVRTGGNDLHNTENKFTEILSTTTDNKHQTVLIENEIAELEGIIKDLSMAFDEVTKSADNLSMISQNLIK